jgi:hypothetical protein
VFQPLLAIIRRHSQHYKKKLYRLYSKCHVTSNKAPHSWSNPAHILWWEEFLNTRSSNRITCFEGALQTTGRLSLLTSLNPLPCLKFFFCSFKVTIGLVRSYVTLTITVEDISYKKNANYLTVQSCIKKREGSRYLS